MFLVVYHNTFGCLLHFYLLIMMSYIFISNCYWRVHHLSSDFFLISLLKCNCWLQTSSISFKSCTKRYLKKDTTHLLFVICTDSTSVIYIYIYIYHYYVIISFEYLWLSVHLSHTFFEFVYLRSIAYCKYLVFPSNWSTKRYLQKDTTRLRIEFVYKVHR